MNQITVNKLKNLKIKYEGFIIPGVFGPLVRGENSPEFFQKIFLN